MTAAVIFDFDGTILDTERPAYQAAAELWAEHGIDLTIEDWAWRIGTSGHADPFTELQHRLGRALDPALNERRIARKNQLTDEAPLNPGVLAWLDEAERLGVPVGIASSSPSSWIERNLARLGLRDRFSCLACVDVHPAKPDPTSFRHAVEELGGDPERSVAVEDSEHGITAARGAGLFVVAVPHDLTAHMDLTGADAVVTSLDDLTLGQALAQAATRSG
ncbi:MAG: phosphoglycolate phosphatase [Actinomycetia bacterium]|nr:phosphoglycolate phosphatase [Actinomycetes bacterium]